jgi:hypothetical protein
MDDSWKTPVWQGRILEQIPTEKVISFAEWRDKDAAQRQFEKLVEAIAVFQP